MKWKLQLYLTSSYFLVVTLKALLISYCQSSRKEWQLSPVFTRILVSYCSYWFILLKESQHFKDKCVIAQKAFLGGGVADAED